jgi:hypothetical protein
MACTTSVLGSSPCNPDSSPVFACRPGHTGRLCAACEDGYFRRNGLCWRCETVGIVTVTVLVGVLLAAILGVAVRVGRAVYARGESGGSDPRVLPGSTANGWAEAEATPTASPSTAMPSQQTRAAVPAPSIADMRPMTLLQIFLFFAQTLSLSMDGFELASSLGVVKEVYDLTNLSVTALGAGCVFGRLPFREGHLAAWLTPVALVAAVWLVTAALCVGSRRARTSPGVRRAVLRIASSASLVVLSITFFPTAKGALSKFRSARDPATREVYFAEAPDVLFDAIPPAEKVVPVVLFPVLVSVCFCALTALLAARLRRGVPFADAVPTVAPWFFLGFREPMWAVPLALFARRLAVAAIVALVPTNNALRYAIVALIILASAGATMYLRPYRISAVNTLEAFSLLTAAAIFVTSFIAANNAFVATDELTVVILILHASAVAAFVATAYVVARRIWRQSGRAQESANLVRPYAVDVRDGEEGGWNEKK